MNLVAVFIGGGLGSVCRYGISHLFTGLSLTALPWATLTSNFISAAVLGGAVVRFSDEGLWPAFLTIGFCGGFSTFSTFSHETLQLMRNGQTAWAVLNVLVNVGLCVFVLFVLSKLEK